MPIARRSLSISGTLARLLAATSLVASGSGLTFPATAQDAVDPPWRVGRLAQLTGSVSTHGAGATDWTDAQLNVPLTSGDAVWTQPQAGAAIQVADNVVALNGATELDLATLDNHQFIATEPQGELFLDLRDVPSGDNYTITTPRGGVQLGGAGLDVSLHEHLDRLAHRRVEDGSGDRRQDHPYQRRDHVAGDAAGAAGGPHPTLQEG